MIVMAKPRLTVLTRRRETNANAAGQCNPAGTAENEYVFGNSCQRM